MLASLGLPKASGLDPDAYILMIDALPEQQPILAQACREIGNANDLIALLGECDADVVPFFVADTEARPDLINTGSSKFRENTAFPMIGWTVAQRRLDTLLRRARPRLPP